MPTVLSFAASSFIFPLHLFFFLVLFFFRWDCCFMFVSKIERSPKRKHHSNSTDYSYYLFSFIYAVE